MSANGNGQSAGPISLDNSLQVPPADGNLSFVLQKVDEIEFEQRPVKKPLANQVQVNIRQVRRHCLVQLPLFAPLTTTAVRPSCHMQTGICGSDTHYWKHGSIGDFVLTKPMVSKATTCMAHDIISSRNRSLRVPRSWVTNPPVS